MTRMPDPGALPSVDELPPAATVFMQDTWATMVRQVRQAGAPGVTYERHTDERWPQERVDCLVYRNRKGDPIGILCRYGDMPPFEKAGNVNIWTRPDRAGRGIATKLLTDALRRWDDIDLRDQGYTHDGLSFVRRFLGGEPLPPETDGDYSDEPSDRSESRVVLELEGDEIAAFLARLEEADDEPGPDR